MIGGRFLRYMAPTPPRHMARLNLFLNFLKYKIDDASQRATYITPDGYGSRLLTQIIKHADLAKLLIPGDPHGLTGPGLLPILKDLEKFIDVRTGKHTTERLFVKSRTPCFELMVPVRSTSPMTMIPFDKPYSDPTWRQIRPLRICDMGGANLTMSLHTDYLTYTKHGPTHAIYTLDVFALVSKFVAYYHAYPSSQHIDQTILDFVHDEVVVPALLQDSAAIWLRNVYKQQLIVSSPLETHTSTVWDTVTIDTIGSDFTGAMLDVAKLRDDLVAQSITPQTALHSLLLSVDKQSFAQYYKTLHEQCQLPDQQPYMWVDCVMTLPWLEFVVMVASFTPSHPQSISLQRDVLRDVRLWLMMRPWNEVSQSIPLKSMVRNRLEGLHVYISERI